MKRILLIPAVAAALFSTSFAQNPFQKFIGKPAPAFSLKTLSGKTLTNANTKGKVVLIDMWASWCGPCKAASPTMQELHKKFASKGLMVVGANVMDGSVADSKMQSAKYQKEHKFSYTFAFGADPLAEKFGVQGIPFFVVIDRTGIVRDVMVGFSAEHSPSVFANSISKWLK